jgi:type II secretory pathway pseudopilin PulG
MTRAPHIKSESGYTLVELMVAMAAGMIVIFAVTSFIMIALRHSSEVSARVDATQQARSTLFQVMDELHSACIAPQIAPVKAGSTGTSLSFIHQRGSAVAPTPVLSTLALNEGTLLESNYSSTGGTAPNWTFAGSPSSTRELSTSDISPTGSNTGIFSYYDYSGGQVSSTPLPTPLSEANAARTVQVDVAFTAAPTSTPVVDENGPAGVQDTALLRFSPAPYNESATNLPCQ